MNLTNFLIELSSDPKEAAAFKKDPKHVMAKAGLSNAKKEVLLNGDAKAIRQAVDQEKLGHRVVTINLISVMVSAAH